MINLYWNHRVFKSNDGHYDVYEIHEVYYNDDDTIMGYTEGGQRPGGETVEELKADLQWMLEACDKPVIDKVELEAHFERLREQEARKDEEGFMSVFTNDLFNDLDSDKTFTEDDQGNWHEVI